MDANQFQLWVVISSIIVAVCFIVMAIAIIAIALIVRSLVKTVNRVEAKVEPLIGQVKDIGDQGKAIAAQFSELSGYLVIASKNVSDSTALIKDEVVELKQLVGTTAITAKDRVEDVSEAIVKTQRQVLTTADYIGEKIVKPASEIAAVMVGIRKGLEVLFAPSPKRIDRAYHDDEMFIG